MTDARGAGRAAALALAVLLACVGCGAPGAAASAGGLQGAASAARAADIGAPVAAPGSDFHRLVSLGDSVPAGVGCDCDAFPALIAAALTTAQGRPVEAVDDAVSGLTASDLAAQLSTDGDEDVRADVAGADLVVITVGANDVVEQADITADDGSGAGGETTCDASCFGPITERVATLVGDDAAAVRRLNPTARIVVTSYWNVFPDGADVVPDATRRAWTSAVTGSFNSDLETVARRDGLTYADLSAPFSRDGSADPGPLLLDDGDHPDSAGHRVIAQAVLDALAG